MLGIVIRMQPWETACPIDQVSSVPCIPAPSKKPIQRALIGLSGSPAGITCPARLRAGRVRHAPSWVHGPVLYVVEAGGRREADLAPRDLEGPDEPQVALEAQPEAPPVDGQEVWVATGELSGGDAGLRHARWSAE